MSLCQYCDKPRVGVGYMFGMKDAPVSLCEEHYFQHVDDFPIFQKITEDEAKEEATS